MRGVSLTIEGADLPADDEQPRSPRRSALCARRYTRPTRRPHSPFEEDPDRRRSRRRQFQRGCDLEGAVRTLGTPDDRGGSARHWRASLGSDVPFFLLGGRARGRGRGEAVAPLPDGPQEWVLLVFPPFSLSTAEVYGRLRARSLTGSPSATKVSGSETGGGPERNDLEQAAESLRGELRRIRSALAGAGARSARLSGSGSTVFGTFGTKEEASRAMTSLEGLGNETKARMAIVKTVSRAEFARRAAPVRLEQRG